jgi:Asp-tRNA(Asn)/Glu-tRNA(Gln) amidotransferase A subunit family amidase
VNPKINAIVTLLSEDALKGADAADKVVASGAELGPLHGVPFSIKDCIDTAGVPSQRGSKLFAGFIPDKDVISSTISARLIRIPLILINAAGNEMIKTSK